jgi:hypothetical protein
VIHSRHNATAPRKTGRQGLNREEWGRTGKAGRLKEENDDRKAWLWSMNISSFTKQ